MSFPRSGHGSDHRQLCHHFEDRRAAINIFSITRLDILAAGTAILIAANKFCQHVRSPRRNTPPVCLAAFAGSAIAKSNPMKTGVQATKLGIAAFIIPFIFVFNPQMLLFGVADHPVQMVWMIISSIIGIVGVAMGTEGYMLTNMKWYERILALVGGLGLVTPGLLTDFIGGVLLLAVVVLQILKSKRTVKPMPA